MSVTCPFFSAERARKNSFFLVGPRRNGRLSPGCRSVGLCRALSGLCRDSVGTLSGLCRLTTVGALSASVGLCRPLSTDPDRYYACTVSTSVGLSRLCQSVGLSVCRPLSVSVEASVVILSGALTGALSVSAKSLPVHWTL